MSLTATAQPTRRTQPSQPTRTIAFVAYPGLTLLDLVGPLQVFSALQSVRDGFRVVVVGERLRVLKTDTPLDVVPDSTFDCTTDPYTVVVPGGLVPTPAATADRSLLDGIRRAAAHAEVVGSAIPVAERWMEDGPYLTAAGVSAGIDMALHLVSRMTDEQTAREVQLLIEYDPQPPFGGIDWGTVGIESHAPVAQHFLTEALTGHPDLLALLRR
jgi:transcriptional regulator GlxA family with amidase domain